MARQAFARGAIGNSGFGKNRIDWCRQSMKPAALFSGIRDGLTSQIQRAAYSIPSNIAEGYGLGTDAESSRFLKIAMGSASGLENFLLPAKDLGILDHETYQRRDQQVIEGKKTVGALIAELKADR